MEPRACFSKHTNVHTLNRLACPRSHAQTKKYTSGDSFLYTTNSVDLLRVLAIACDVTTEDLPGFVHQLAEGHGGLSLEYMYHRDSLRSGTSYQNSGHIRLQDNCQVDTPSPLFFTFLLFFLLFVLSWNFLVVLQLLDTSNCQIDTPSPPSTPAFFTPILLLPSLFLYSFLLSRSFSRYSKNVLLLLVCVLLAAITGSGSVCNECVLWGKCQFWGKSSKIFNSVWIS